MICQRLGELLVETEFTLTLSRMCFYLYVFLASAQLFPCLTAAYASTLKLRL